LINKNYLIFFLLFFSLVNSQEKNGSNAQYLQTLDLITDGRDDDKTKEQRVSSLMKAKDIIVSIGNDSLKNIAYYKLSNSFLILEDSLNFRIVNRKGILLSQKINDSKYLANHYWDLGWHYELSEQKDSAYRFYDSSQKILKKTNRAASAARLLLRIARIQKDVKDYTGSEASITEAIEILKPLNDNRRLYNCYNYLGIIYKNLENYEKSIEYHKTALKYLQKVKQKNEVLKTFTLNNIGLIYRYQGKYEEAIINFQDALSYDSLYNKNPTHYATVLDNLAYSKFLSDDTSELPELFEKALKIRDSLEYKSGIAVSKLHLAEFYLQKNDTVQSIKYVSEARNAAIESENKTESLPSGRW